MISRRGIMIGAAFIFASEALAQAHSHAAPNGGQIINVGKFELELTVKGQEINLYLTDEKEQKVDAGLFKATALVLAKGNQQKSIELLPAGGNRLTAKYDFAIDGKFRATITLITKDSEVGKGRFNLDVKR